MFLERTEEHQRTAYLKNWELLYRTGRTEELKRRSTIRTWNSYRNHAQRTENFLRTIVSEKLKSLRTSPHFLGKASIEKSSYLNNFDPPNGKHVTSSVLDTELLSQKYSIDYGTLADPHLFTWNWTECFFLNSRLGLLKNLFQKT